MPDYPPTIEGITGNIGKEPKAFTTKSGKDMTTFPIGIYAGRDKDSEENNTEWFDVLCMNDMVLLAAKFHKGQKVKVTGNLNSNTWTDKEGKARKTLGIWATDIVAQETAPTTSVADEIDLGDDIPF